MFFMRLYFVRHGEGHHNTNKLYSTPDFELTDLGKDQARGVTERLLKLPIEIIISSPYKRTIQTTEIINQKLKKEVIFSDLVAEIKRPKEIAGKSMVDDHDVNKIKKQMDKNINDQNWHYSDEENFFDFRKRTLEFLEYIKGFKQEHILVVSHVLFIQMVVLVMMLGEELTPEVYLKAHKFLASETSGLTICQTKGERWELVTWNDHSHLLETKDSATG